MLWHEQLWRGACQGRQGGCAGSVWEHEGRVKGASNVDGKSQKSHLPIPGELDSRRVRQKAPIVLLFPEKIPTDPCPSSISPKISQ